VRLSFSDERSDLLCELTVHEIDAAEPFVPDLFGKERSLWRRDREPGSDPKARILTPNPRTEPRIPPPERETKPGAGIPSQPPSLEVPETVELRRLLLYGVTTTVFPCSTERQ
jgi:hypothetical protein